MCDQKLALVSVCTGCYIDPCFWNTVQAGELVMLAQSASNPLLHPLIALSLPILTNCKVGYPLEAIGVHVFAYCVKVSMEVEALLLIEFNFALNTGNLGVF